MALQGELPGDSVNGVLVQISGGAAPPTGAATSAKQDTGNTSLASIDTKIKGAPTSTDVGANNALADTNSHAFASKATTIGKAVFSCPLANTAAVYLGRGSGVTTGTGIELLPGDSIILECANTNEWFAITGTATQNVHVVAL